MIKCYFDGCCEPINPGGYCGYGSVIFKNEERIWEFSGFLNQSPKTSNNVGEYLAFTEILKELLNRSLEKENIEIYGDSKLVINQMFGNWRMNKGLYIPYAMEASKLLNKFSQCTGWWIPREENYIADELSKAELIKRKVEFRIQPRTMPPTNLGKGEAESGAFFATLEARDNVVGPLKPKSLEG